MGGYCNYMNKGSIQVIGIYNLIIKGLWFHLNKTWVNLGLSPTHSYNLNDQNFRLALGPPLAPHCHCHWTLQLVQNHFFTIQENNY